MLMREIDAALASFGDSRCLDAGGGGPVTGHGMSAGIGRAVSTLLSLGLAAGDRVLVVADRNLDAATLYFACLRTGAAFTALDPAVDKDALGAVLDDAQPTILVAPQATLTRSAQKLRMSRVRTALTMERDGGGTYRDLCAGQQPSRTSMLVRPGDLALLHYDLTRAPRALTFTHAALARQARLAKGLLGLRKGQRLALALPVWAAPPSLATLAAAWMSGAAVQWMSAPGAHDADVLLADADDEASVAGRAMRTLSRSGPAGAGAYVAIDEAGLIAAKGDDGAMRVLPELESRLEDGKLVIADKCLFSGYWRRAQDSERALEPGMRFRTGLAARPQPDGSVVLADQP